MHIADEKAVFEATWDGQPYPPWLTRENQNVLARAWSTGRRTRGGPWTFNWIVRRTPCMLVSGDLPRVALAEKPTTSEVNPPFLRLGDLRVRVRIGDQALWLDEHGTVVTRYHPWGTVHRVNLMPDWPLEFELRAALAETSGIAVTLAVARGASSGGTTSVSSPCREPVQAAGTQPGPPRMPLTPPSPPPSPCKQGEGAEAAVLPRPPQEGEGRGEGSALPPPPPVIIEIHYGWLDYDPVRFYPEYLRAHPDGYPWHIPSPVTRADAVACDATGATLSNPALPHRVGVATEPAVRPTAADDPDCRRPVRRAVFAFAVPADGPATTIRLLACKASPRPRVAGGEIRPPVAQGHGEASPLDVTRVDEYFARTERYYAELLAGSRIETPDPVLNTAFYAALVNFDYDYHAPAWLEGVHEWSTFWTNNYQISAAVSLGMFEKARDAILAFGTGKEGPGAMTMTDGSQVPGSVTDGLPYFVIYFHRYWKATGDRATVDRLWGVVCRDLERFGIERDMDDDGLLDFHFACNTFLYQSDHWSLPGAGFSPSIIYAHMLELMAEIADARGEADRAAGWRRRAEYIRNELVRRLWLKDEGRFASGVDRQGLTHKVAYYTDYAYPVLYSQWPASYGWLSLRALDRDLWIGDHLLRTGNLKPDYFGNNAVHPTAMTEGAEAYFRAGRPERGVALLHGTALSATVRTDSPGAFPEFCSEDGYGVPDHVFGNPIGAFLHAVVNGLFGIERTAAGEPFPWHPSIPAAWDRAYLQAGGVAVTVTGAAGARTYTLSLPAAQAVVARFPMFGQAVRSVRDGKGRALDHTIEPHPGGGFLVVRLRRGTDHEARIESRPFRCALAQPSPPPSPCKQGEGAEAAVLPPLAQQGEGRGEGSAPRFYPPPGASLGRTASPPSACQAPVQAAGVEPGPPRGVTPGAAVAWTLPEPGWRVDDPQGVFAAFRIGGRKLRGTLAEARGLRTFFLRDPAGRRLIPCDVDFGSTPAPAPSGPLRLPGRRIAVDLATHFNHDTIPCRDWGSPCNLDFRPVLRPGGTSERGQLDVGSFRFSVRPAGRNVVRLEVAELAFGPDDGLLLKPGLRQREEVPAALFKGRRDVFTLTVGTAERIELPVGRALRGLEFLLSSGSKPRLTGLAVGRVELRFADGFVATHSLVYGREVDSSAFPFATAVAVRAMPHDPTVTLPWHVAAFALPVKERRVVEIVALAVTVMDTHLGLLALNLVVE